MKIFPAVRKLLSLGPNVKRHRATTRQLALERFEPRYAFAVDSLAAESLADASLYDLPDFDGQLQISDSHGPIFLGTKSDIIRFLNDGGVASLVAADDLSIEIIPKNMPLSLDPQSPTFWSQATAAPLIHEVQSAFGVMQSLLDSFFRDEIAARYHLFVTDSAGQLIRTTQPGDEIVLHVEVEDFRSDSRGVLAAFTNLFFSSELLEMQGPPQFGREIVGQLTDSSPQPGRIENIGGRMAGNATGQRTELFTATFRVIGAGPIIFSTTPFGDDSPLQQTPPDFVQLAGMSQPVSSDQIFTLPTILGSYLPQTSLPTTFDFSGEFVSGESVNDGLPTGLSAAGRVQDYSSVTTIWQTTATWLTTILGNLRDGLASVNVFAASEPEVRGSQPELVDAVFRDEHNFIDLAIPPRNSLGRFESHRITSQPLLISRSVPRANESTPRTKSSPLVGRDLISLTDIDRRGTRHFLKLTWRSVSQAYELNPTQEPAPECFVDIGELTRDEQKPTEPPPLQKPATPAHAPPVASKSIPPSEPDHHTPLATELELRPTDEESK